MKKTSIWLFVLAMSLLCLCSCGGNSTISDEPIVSLPESRFDEVNNISSDSNTIAIQDGANYILLTMKNGIASKAEYAFQFGTRAIAESMYNYYEEKGYDPQYSGGYLNGVFLVMTYTDSSKYIGMSEDEIKALFGEKIVSGYFDLSESTT